MLVLFFVDLLDIGFTGICISTSLMWIARFLVVHFMLESNPNLKNIYGVVLFSKESTVNLRHQVFLGINGLLMGVWGWWAFDIFTLISSYLSVDIISA